jgi:hypothetical protein
MFPFSLALESDHENSTTFLPRNEDWEANEMFFPWNDCFQETPTVNGNENAALLFVTVSEANGKLAHNVTINRIRCFMKVPLNK